ncbi:MAG: hypothetical protein HZA25_02735 [Candidatus Niyogibacteria bacterium]|nr:hypothetical protein [Candidatus Niyogibacteria bacterium]
MKKYLREILIGVIIAVVGGVILWQLGLSVSEEKTTVTSYMQSGGVTAETVVIKKEVSVPKPNISIESVSTNIRIEEGYQSEFMIIVDTKIPVKNLYVQANGRNIIKMDIIPQRNGGALLGPSGIRGSYAFQNIQTAYGQYKVRMLTGVQQEIKFEFSYK